MTLLGATFKPSHPVCHMADIIAQVCAERSVPEAELLSSSRFHRVARARQEVAWMARNLLHMSLIEIGSALGRDHSTIVAGLANVRKRLAEKSYAAELATIALRLRPPVKTYDAEKIRRELGCELPHSFLAKRQTVEMPPLEDIELEEVDADACLDLWRTVLEKTLSAALGESSNYFPQREAQQWMGTEDFHTVCDLAGRDGDAILRRYHYQQKLQAGEI